jgi:hypothetical protein
MIVYEERLNNDSELALREGDMFFQGEGAVQKTLQKITRRLEEIGVDYAVVGGMAMYLHGFRRYTEDVDLLVTPEGLAKLHDNLDGLGYVRPFATSKNLRDTETGVRIEFLVSGQYPGDGKPGPIEFPLPNQVTEDRVNTRVLSLHKLVELKLASGKAPGRRKDLGDVQELIRLLSLPREFNSQIHESVQSLYEELWNELHPTPSDD